MEITKQERTAVSSCIVLFVAVAEMVTAEGIDTYLTYTTLPPNPFMPLHLTHTMRSQAHITRTQQSSPTLQSMSQTAADM